MVLDRKDGQITVAQTLDTAIEQRDMCHLKCIRQRRLINSKAMVLAGNLDLACGQILDRMIGAAMTASHFEGAGAKRFGNQLMTDADAKHRQARFGNFADRLAGITCRCCGVARAV